LANERQFKLTNAGSFFANGLASSRLCKWPCFQPRLATGSKVSREQTWKSKAMNPTARKPAVGIGYRAAIDAWTRENLGHFDVLEITVDHCLEAGKSKRSAIFDLVGRIALTAHGIGLSIGTDVPIDLDYLERVAAVVERLKAPAYSEHLAFTRVPGLDLANLLPLPQTEAVADALISKIRTIRSHIGVPFLLENISYLFTWPDSKLSDAEFLALICGETGTGLLLDIENLYLNACNHGFDPYEFLDRLPLGLVKEIHMAGGTIVQGERLGSPIMADSHSHPVPDEAFRLLDRVLERHAPDAIVLERDDRLDAADEIMSDVRRIRSHLGCRFSGGADVESVIAATDQAA
jgi:uncharacterized protein (UPF0276 family)